jgi:hypothetical protein
VTTPSPVVNSGLIWRESAALKTHLANQIRLADRAHPDGQVVPVYFALPDNDARRRQFPYLLLDFITIRREPDREHRGRWYAARDIDGGYRPDGYDPPHNSPVAPELPVPISVVFQISGWSRHRQHALAMVVALMRLLPFRFGSLAMVADPHSPDDGTHRRLDLLSGPDLGGSAIEPGQDDPNKRVFPVRATVAVSAEMLPADFLTLGVVEEVIFDPPSRPGFEGVFQD